MIAKQIMIISSEIGNFQIAFAMPCTPYRYGRQIPTEIVGKQPCPKGWSLLRRNMDLSLTA